IPGRLHVTWQDDNTLRLDTDAGTQSRIFHFMGAEAPTPGVAKSLQGYSRAAWEFANALDGEGRVVPGVRKGSLKVVTNQFKGVSVLKMGVQSIKTAALAEYSAGTTSPTGPDWFVLTAIVEDPLYLNPPFVVSTNFKKEADGAKWNPTPCSAR